MPANKRQPVFSGRRFCSPTALARGGPRKPQSFPYPEENPRPSAQSALSAFYPISASTSPICVVS